MNSKKSRLHQIAAAATAFCVAFTQVAIAAPAFSVSTPEVSLPDTLRLDQALQISVPSSVASIDKLIPGSGKTIFHIQTAHGQYQAEKQIETLLTHLEKNYGVETVLMEGASQPLNPEIINFFPEDRKSTLEAVDAFVRHSVISGPEVFLLNSGKAKGLGIEDEAAYERNLQDFAAVISARDASGQFLADLDQSIERLAAVYLSSDARSFLKQVERKETGDVPFDIYLQQLKLAAEKYAGVNLADAAWQLLWPMLTRVFTIEKLEKKIDPAVFKKQKEEFLKAIKPYAVKASVADESLFSEVEKLLSLKDLNARLPDPETSALFESLVRALPSDFNYDAYSSVTAFCGLLMLKSQLRVDLLADEISRMEDKVANKLAETQNAKALVSNLKDYRMLKKLFALELLPADFDALSNRPIKPSQIVEKLKAINGNARAKSVEFKNTPELESLYAKAVRFYEGARLRDTKMLSRIEEQLSSTGANKVAVVTGGFHSEPFAQYFEDRGYNYALMTPKLSTVDAQGRQNYLDVMQMWASAPKSVAISSSADIGAATIQPRPANPGILARFASRVLNSELFQNFQVRYMPRFATGAVIAGGLIAPINAIAQAPTAPKAPAGVVAQVKQPVVLPMSIESQAVYERVNKILKIKSSGASKTDKNATAKMKELSELKDSNDKVYFSRTLPILLADPDENSDVRYESLARLIEIVKKWSIPSNASDEIADAAVLALKKSTLEFDAAKLLELILAKDSSVSPTKRASSQKALDAWVQEKMKPRAKIMKAAEKGLAEAGNVGSYHTQIMALNGLLLQAGITEQEVLDIIGILGRFLVEPSNVARSDRETNNVFTAMVVLESTGNLAAVPYFERYIRTPDREESAKPTRDQQARAAIDSIRGKNGLPPIVRSESRYSDMVRTVSAGAVIAGGLITTSMDVVAQVPAAPTTPAPIVAPAKVPVPVLNQAQISQKKDLLALLNSRPSSSKQDVKDKHAADQVSGAGLAAPEVVANSISEFITLIGTSKNDSVKQALIDRLGTLFQIYNLSDRQASDIMSAFLKIINSNQSSVVRVAAELGLFRGFTGRDFPSNADSATFRANKLFLIAVKEDIGLRVAAGKTIATLLSSSNATPLPPSDFKDAVSVADALLKNNKDPEFSALVPVIKDILNAVSGNPQSGLNPTEIAVVVKLIEFADSELLRLQSDQIDKMIKKLVLAKTGGELVVALDDLKFYLRDNIASQAAKDKIHDAVAARLLVLPNQEDKSVNYYTKTNAVAVLNQLGTKSIPVLKQFRDNPAMPKEARDSADRVVRGLEATLPKTEDMPKARSEARAPDLGKDTSGAANQFLGRTNSYSVRVLPGLAPQADQLLNQISAVIDLEGIHFEGSKEIDRLVAIAQKVALRQEKEVDADEMSFLEALPSKIKGGGLRDKLKSDLVESTQWLSRSEARISKDWNGDNDARQFIADFLRDAGLLFVGVSGPVEIDLQGWSNEGSRGEHQKLSLEGVARGVDLRFFEVIKKGKDQGVSFELSNGTGAATGLIPSQSLAGMEWDSDTNSLTLFSPSSEEKTFKLSGITLSVRKARSEARTTDFAAMRKELEPFIEKLGLDETDVEYFLAMLYQHRLAEALKEKGVASSKKKIGETFWPSAMLTAEQAFQHMNEIQYPDLLAQVEKMTKRPDVNVRFNSLDGGLGTTVDRFRANLLDAIEKLKLSETQEFKITLNQGDAKIEVLAKGDPRVLLEAMVRAIDKHNKAGGSKFDKDSRIDFIFNDANSGGFVAQSFVSIKAKGIDLPFDIVVNGKKMRVTVSEIKAHRMHLDRKGYKNANFRPLVNEDSAPSYEEFLDLPYFYDVAYGVAKPRTYRELLSEDNLSVAERKDFVMQMKLPNVRIDEGQGKYAAEKPGDLTIERTAPANHGQLGFRIVVDILNRADAIIAESERTGVTQTEVFQNGDNASSTISPEIAHYMAANNIPMMIVSTDKAPVDMKGGQIGIEAKVNADGTLEGVTINADGTITIAQGAPIKVTIMEKAEAKDGDLAKFFPMGIDGKFGLPGRKQSFNTNVIVFNATVLAKMLKKLESVLGRTELLKQISPDNISEIKKKGEQPFYQLGGAISSLVFNLNSIFTLADKTTAQGQAIRAIHDGSILTLVNLNVADRSKFFAPLKTAVDYALLNDMHFYGYVDTGWLDILPEFQSSELPQFTLGAEDEEGEKTADGKKTDAYYKDTLNAKDAFVGVTPINLHLKVLKGFVALPGARLEGEIVITSDFPTVYDLSNSSEAALAPYKKNGRLELTNVNVSISKEGAVSVSARSEARKGVDSNVGQVIGSYLSPITKQIIQKAPTIDRGVAFGLRGDAENALKRYGDFEVLFNPAKPTGEKELKDVDTGRTEEYWPALNGDGNLTQSGAPDIRPIMDKQLVDVMTEPFWSIEPPVDALDESNPKLLLLLEQKLSKAPKYDRTYLGLAADLQTWPKNSVTDGTGPDAQVYELIPNQEYEKLSKRIALLREKNVNRSETREVALNIISGKWPVQVSDVDNVYVTTVGRDEDGTFNSLKAFLEAVTPRAAETSTMPFAYVENLVGKLSQTESVAIYHQAQSEGPQGQPARILWMVGLNSDGQPVTYVKFAELEAAEQEAALEAVIKPTGVVANVKSVALKVKSLGYQKERAAQIVLTVDEPRVNVIPGGIGPNGKVVPGWGIYPPNNQPLPTEVQLPANLQSKRTDARDRLSIYGFDMTNFMPGKPFVISDPDDDKALAWLNTEAGLLWNDLLGRLSTEQRGLVQTSLDEVLKLAQLPLDDEFRFVPKKLNLAVDQDEVVGVFVEGENSVIKPLIAFSEKSTPKVFFSAESQGQNLAKGIADLRAVALTAKVNPAGKLEINPAQRSESRLYTVLLTNREPVSIPTSHGQRGYQKLTTTVGNFRSIAQDRAAFDWAALFPQAEFAPALPVLQNLDDNEKVTFAIRSTSGSQAQVIAVEFDDSVVRPFVFQGISGQAEQAFNSDTTLEDVSLIAAQFLGVTPDAVSKKAIVSNAIMGVTSDEKTMTLTLSSDFRRSEARKFIVVDTTSAAQSDFMASVLEKAFPQGVVKDFRFQVEPFKGANALNFKFIPENETGGVPFEFRFGINEGFDAVESFLVDRINRDGKFRLQHGFLPVTNGRLSPASLRAIEIEPAKVPTAPVTPVMVRSESRELTADEIKTVEVILENFTAGILSMTQAAVALQLNNFNGEQIRGIAERVLSEALQVSESQGEDSVLDSLLGNVDSAELHLKSAAIRLGKEESGVAAEKGISIRTAPEILATIESAPRALVENLLGLGDGDHLDIVTLDGGTGDMLRRIEKLLISKNGIVEDGMRQIAMNRVRVHEKSKLAGFIAKQTGAAVALVMAGYDDDILFNGLETNKNVYKFKLADKQKPLTGKNLWAVPVVHIATKRVMANISGVPAVQAPGIIETSFDQLGLKVTPNKDGSYSFGAIATLLQAIVTAKYIEIMA